MADHGEIYDSFLNNMHHTCTFRPDNKWVMEKEDWNVSIVPVDYESSLVQFLESKPTYYRLFAFHL